ncbi:hypothetical protein NB231_15698 [Nitrococcus mobilis Nb-231]|uniref:Phage MuF C-terminal domain-containing protein n=2 Tax=Nitrococcus mobilis TaxID=35797 RepID=A4BLU0_9GAMM|nr:hypothetical protein NB231_15698 [Nitrococcus mobilis Nb-231]
MAAIDQLPEELADPLLVFEGGKDFPSHVILTERKDSNGKPILVALHLQKREGRLFVNRIASAYGKDKVQSLLGWVEEGRLRYQSNRSPAQVRLIGLQLPQSGTPAQGQSRILPEVPAKGKGLIES